MISFKSRLGLVTALSLSCLLIQTALLTACSESSVEISIVAGELSSAKLAETSSSLYVVVNSSSAENVASSSSVPLSSGTKNVVSSGLDLSSSAKNSSSSERLAVSSSEKLTESSSSCAVKLSSSAKVATSSFAVLSSSSAEARSSSNEKPAGSSDSGVCTKCDSYTPADPMLVENGGKGSVTTYGSITAKETSLGGACNYGQTNIQYYAAIHVNVSPGDDKGPWDGGMACGGCVHVKAKTPDGWKEVTVRITDRCPDANCGVDLGGAPASDVMGNLVGRYYGEWEFVSCEGVKGVWGDSTSIWVKEGASKFWSIIQVRNPKDAVRKIVFRELDDAGKVGDKTYPLEFVVGTENFWTVPQEILQSEKSYSVVVSYRSGTGDEWILKGSELTVPEANLYLYEHRKE